MTPQSDTKDISTSDKTDILESITSAEVYLATDPTYATCLICSVNPTKECIDCGTRVCDVHAPKLLGCVECPLCHAIQLVYQRRRLIEVIRIATKERYERG